MKQVELALMRLRRLRRLQCLRAPQIIIEREYELVEAAFASLEAVGILEVALRFADSPETPSGPSESDKAVA